MDIAGGFSVFYSRSGAFVLIPAGGEESRVCLQAYRAQAAGLFHYKVQTIVGRSHTFGQTAGQAIVAPHLMT